MRSYLRSGWAFLRNTWRGLTSMRTALVLLFLLAVAALPGALIPQRSLNPSEVDRYFEDYPTLAPILDALGVFEVFSSVWFAAIYVLLFISLVGCLVPRCWEYYKQARGKPVRTPRNLRRMPHYAHISTESGVDDVLGESRRRLKHWRRTEFTEADGAKSISAERGYLREAGNLVFHFALLGLLIAVAGGKLYGYEGQVIVQADGSEFCNSGTYNYDSFTAGLNVDGTNLSEFCLRVNDFDVNYLHNGQAVDYRVDMDYQSGDSLENDEWQPYELQVNHPLRTAGDRVYLTGNGYTPQFTVTFPDGEQRTQTTQWQPADQTTMLSQGATKFDPPNVEDPFERRQQQLAITGLFAPTASMQNNVLNSQFPALEDPAAAVDVMRGDLGLDSGRGQSIFNIDQTMVEQGRLERVARENLRPGEEIRLDDGTRVHFDGVQRWVNLQVSHDPFQPFALGFAVTIIFSLAASLMIKRRRIWVRATPRSDGSTLVELGGLARTDQAGYGEEFTRLAGDLLGADRTEPTDPRVASAPAPERKN